VDNAVVGITSREDSQMILAGTTLPIVNRPPKSETEGGGPEPTPPVPATITTGETPVVPITTVPKDVNILNTLSQTVVRYPSQIVTFTSKYINKLSDVASSLNVSGSLSIKYGEISGGGSGSYVDSDTFQSADLNFLVMVKVINQTINVKDQLDFYPLAAHRQATTTEVTYAEFVAVYGDSFISGFQEGGFFHAIVSMRSLDKSNLTNIKADAHVALQFGVGSVSAQGDVSMSKSNLNRDCEVNITVNWAGGGQLKNSDETWTIDSLMATASRFPELVAKCPQRTHAILTKYTALRGFLDWSATRKLTMLDYEVAQLYTDELMDVYLGYKAIWKDIHNLLEDMDEGKAIVKKSTAITGSLSPPFWTTTLKQPPLVPFEPSFEGLDAALRTCRIMMVRIVKEVDDLKVNPKLSVVPERELPYIRPQVFRLLLPVAEYIVPAPDPRSALTAKLNHGWFNFYDFLSAKQAYARQALTQPYSSPPQFLYGMAWLDWAVLPSDGIDVTIQGVDKKNFICNAGVDPVTDPQTPATPVVLMEKQIFWIAVKWIAIPFNSKEFSIGSARWQKDAAKNNGKLSLAQQCSFPTTLEDDPIVLTWLTGWRFNSWSSADKWSGSVSASVSNPTRDGFVLDIDDIGALGDDNSKAYATKESPKPLFAAAQWLAFPRNLTGVDGGTVEFLNLEGKPDKKSSSGRTTFRGGAFTKPPMLWFAVSAFRYKHTGATKSCPRFKMVYNGDADTNGFDWSITTWQDQGVLEMARFTWFAFESDAESGPLETNISPGVVAADPMRRGDILTGP